MKHIVAVLHNVRSMHNVGSIFRTADAAGVRKIFLTGITPAPLDRFGRARPQLVKVSLGAEKTVAWEHARSATKLLKELKADGYKVLAVEQSRKSIPYYKLPKSYVLSPKFCLVLGNEVKGLSSSVLALADKILEIPMRGALVRDARHPRRAGPLRRSFSEASRGKESLNVSVAFGIVVYTLAFGYNKRKT